MMLGVTGIYIGKIYDRVKGRPTFIISETVNMENNEHDTTGNMGH